MTFLQTTNPTIDSKIRIFEIVGHDRFNPRLTAVILEVEFEGQIFIKKVYLNVKAA